MTGGADDLARRLERGGVVPAVPVPFDRHGDIDEEMQTLYVEWMRRQAPAAVAVWAHTGRGLLLEREPRLSVLERWRTAGLPVICGVGVPASVDLPTDPVARTDTVLQVLDGVIADAKTGGAAGLLVHPPTPLHGLADEAKRIRDYHEVAARSGVPWLAFHLYDAAGGVSYDAALLERILDLDGALGMKLATLDSVMTFQDIAQAILRRGRLVVTGEDRFLGYSFTMGACGALIGMAAACTDVPIALANAWHQGDLPRFVDLTIRLDAFSQATFRHPMDGYVQRMLWALEADGVLPRAVFDPFGPRLAADERGDVFAAVAQLRSS